MARIFISFAVEDKTYRDFLVGQKLNTNNPIEFTDYSVKEPWDTSWKTKCRARIQLCSGMIALISNNTMSADGARWEMKCGNEENIPILGIQIHKDSLGRTPPEFGNNKVILWNANAVANFINSL